MYSMEMDNTMFSRIQIIMLINRFFFESLAEECFYETDIRSSNHRIVRSSMEVGKYL
jgi:hypothetical protein